MKTYVLDTNVLLHDPQAILKFADNTVILPLTVIEEIDRFKKDQSETGRNARQISRMIDEFRQVSKLIDGVALENGGVLKVAIYKKELIDKLPPDLRDDHGDNRILSIAKDLQENSPANTVFFVTKDINLRIKADTIGLCAQDYRNDKVPVEELYTGTGEVYLAKEKIDQFYELGELELEAEFFSNQGLTLINEANPSQTALGRYDSTKRKIMPLTKVPKEGIWGIYPRNREQHFAFDLLLNDDIQLVSLVGKAGTGKTLLAIAAGLLKTADESAYNRLLVSRPVFPMGRDLGFLPGDIEEKLAPWMQPIFDNVELLLSSYDESGNRKRGYRELIDLGLMEIEPLTYIRGRSIPKQYMIVDEAQNLTPHEIKTIITRAGDGTKIVLTGDPFQIDNPYVDSASNGLSYSVERLKGQTIAGHTTLNKGERSALAELAANLL
ncbi:MAG: phosphate starvation-inducible protein PhoH [Desulfuromonas sp.]|nr:MAG: phosphate starvation-inducible protein PhoH [Desulfuromonas sp.]